MIHAAPAVLVKSLHDSFHALTGVAIASRLCEPKRKSPLAILLLQSASKRPPLRSGYCPDEASLTVGRLPRTQCVLWLTL
jgi:hypothetical protein